tara:strand:- start:588 stop:1226 length:639 start_codon:yes stop_codon:yes gene_type:complete
MKLDFYSQQGSKVSSIEIDKTVFGIEPNESVVQQAVNTELTNLRQGTRSSKNRSKVRGGGKKPFKQKGRGGARAGTIRSPLWRGGGTVFGPQPYKYCQKMPKKMKELAKKSVLSNHYKNESILVIESLEISSPNTKKFLKILTDLNLNDKKITALYNTLNDNFILSSRNLKNVYSVNVMMASTYDIIDCDVLLIEKEAVERLNFLFSSKNEK